MRWFFCLMLTALAWQIPARGESGATESPLGSISVTDHGARGDGASDDTIALQNAINAAIAANKPLYIPSGRYLVQSDIRIDGALDITGNGHSRSVLTSNGRPARMIIRHGNTSLKDLGFEEMIEPVALESRGDHDLEDIAIERCRFEGIVVRDRNRGVIGLTSGAASQREFPIRRLVVRDCIFRKIDARAINVRANISDARIVNNVFENIINPLQEGEEGLGGGLAIRLGESAEADEGEEVFLAQGHHRISQNIIRGMRKNTRGGPLIGILIYGDFTIIRDNVIEDIDGTAFGDDVNAMYIRGAYNSVLDNIIRHIHGADDDGALSFKGGVQRGSQHNVLSGNLIQDIRGMSAVEVSSTNLRFTNNTIENAPVRGFFHRLGRNLWLEDNIFIDADAVVRTRAGVAAIKNNRFLNSSLVLCQFRRRADQPRDAVYIEGNYFENNRPGSQRMIRMANGVLERFVAIRNNRFHNHAPDADDQGGRIVDLRSSGHVIRAEIKDNHVVQSGPYESLFVVDLEAGPGIFDNNSILIDQATGPVLSGNIAFVENNTVHVTGDAAGETLRLFDLTPPSGKWETVFRNNRVLANGAAVIGIKDLTAERNPVRIEDNQIAGAPRALAVLTTADPPQNPQIGGNTFREAPARQVLIEQPPANMDFSGNGSGTKEDPFRIENAVQLQEVAGNPKAHFILAGDIVATETRHWGNGTGFQPIGTPRQPFQGSLNGRGNVIEDLHVDLPNQSHVGLFGVLGDGAEIRNLGLERATVRGFQAVGVLAGTNRGGLISQVFSNGQVSGTHDIGGLVGTNTDGTVANSYSLADVTAQSDAGGLIGFNGGVVENCYAAGRLTALARAHGLVGYNATWSEDCAVRNSFWRVDAGTLRTVWVEPKTTSELKDIATFTGGEASGDWDIAPDTAAEQGVWRIRQAKDYPRLSWESAKRESTETD